MNVYGVSQSSFSDSTSLRRCLNLREVPDKRVLWQDTIRVVIELGRNAVEFPQGKLFGSFCFVLPGRKPRKFFPKIY